METLMKQTDLLEAFQHTAFVIKTQQQLIKDFNLAGIELNGVHVEDAMSYDSLLTSIKTPVEHCFQHDFAGLTNLFYILDLPQSLVDTQLTDEHPAEKLAELILARAAFKVFLKQKFSGE